MKLCQTVIILALTLVWVLAGCQYNKCADCAKLDKQKKQEEAAAQKQKQPLSKEAEEKLAKALAKRLDSLREALKKMPLFEKWHHKFNQEKVGKMYVIEDLLLVETQTNAIFALDRQNGYPYWVYNVGDALDFPPEIHKDQVYFLCAGSLHILDKKTGALLHKKSLDFVPCSPLGASDKFLYIGGWDNFLYTLNMKNGDREWRYRIDGYVWGRPTVAEGTLYIAGTDERVYAIHSYLGNTINKWGDGGRYATRGPNVTQILAPANRPLLYVGSRDYNLYNLSRYDGSLRWKFESGGEITRPLHLVGNSLYLISERELNKSSVLYVLDSETGQPKWSLEHGKQILFLGKQYDWVVQDNQKLTAMESLTGKAAHTFDFDSFDVYTTNPQDNLGYLATKDGFVFAVEER